MGEISKIKAQTHNRFLNLYEFETVKKTGRPGRYFVASRSETIEGLKASSHENNPDGVVMYAVTEDLQKVLLVRQYRYPIDRYVYELPAGLCEQGESYRGAAVREVYEETGLAFRPIEADPAYETPRYMTVGMTDESCAIVFGYVSGELSDAHQEESEEIVPVLADKEEVRRILREEAVAASCAYHIERFLTDADPFAYIPRMSQEP